MFLIQKIIITFNVNFGSYFCQFDKFKISEEMEILVPYFKTDIPNSK